MIELFYNGGPVMYPLLLCSVISMTIIIERCFFWIGTGLKKNQPLADEILSLVEKGNFDRIHQKASISQNCIVRMITTGILHRDHSMIKAMESSAADEINRMQQFMGVLDTMITIAPLLGILGTVTGIITSFDVLGRSGIQAPQAVTGGIAQALITTAAGLSISIITVFPYNYFNSKIKRTARMMEKYATRFEIIYKHSQIARNQVDKTHGEKDETAHTRGH